MDVEPLGLETGEAVGDDLEAFPHGFEMIESFLQTEVTQVVGAEFIAQEAGELLVLFEEGIFPVGAEHMMTMLDLIDDGGQLPMEPLVQPDAKDLADAIGSEPPKADFAASLKNLVDGEMALENEVAAVLDLGDGVEPRQVQLGAFLFGELRAQDEGPVIELLANQSGAQPVGGCLQGGDVVHGQKGVVVFVKADAGALQFPLHEGVAVEPIGSMERKETGHADDDRPQHLIADVEVIVGKAAALVSEDAVVGILRGKLWHGDAEGPALFHALEDEVDAVGPVFLHAA